MEKILENLGRLAAHQLTFKRTITGYEKTWRKHWKEALRLKRQGKTRGYVSENPAGIWEHVREILPEQFEGDVIFLGPWVWKEYARRLRNFAREKGKRLVLVDIINEPLIYALTGRDAKRAVRALLRIKSGTKFAPITHRLGEGVVPVRREYIMEAPPLRGLIVAHEFTPLVSKELTALIKMIAQGPVVLTFRKTMFSDTVSWIKRVAEALGASIVEKEVQHPRGHAYWVARIDPPRDRVGRALLEALATVALTTRIRPLKGGRDVEAANAAATRALKLAVRSAARRLKEGDMDEFLRRLKLVLCAGLEKTYPDICGG